MFENISFSLLGALLGGIAIGLSAGLLYWTQGRVAGISGMLGNVLRRDVGTGGFRVFFLLGLLLSPLLWSLLVGTPVVPPPGNSAWSSDWPALLLAGLLVGFGTRMANGCTSGHGVCGLARFSRRSLMAVLSFMGAGIVTVFVVRHLLGG